MNLDDYAALAGWPTPAANEYESQDRDRTAARREECKARTGNGNGFGLTLGQAVQQMLAGWGTPTSRDAKDAGPAFEADPTVVPTASRLARQAAALAASGASTTSSPAGTAPGGVLSPAHSRWLQGYPAAWDRCSPGWESWALIQRLLGGPRVPPGATGSGGCGGTATP